MIKYKVFYPELKNSNISWIMLVLSLLNAHVWFLVHCAPNATLFSGRCLPILIIHMKSDNFFCQSRSSRRCVHVRTGIAIFMPGILVNGFRVSKRYGGPKGKNSIISYEMLLLFLMSSPVSWWTPFFFNPRSYPTVV